MASSKNKGRVSLDERFYLSADKFFLANAGLGLTYDDVSLATRYSEVLPRMTRLDSSLSDALALSLPILSSDMDTVTEHRMAIAMALNGGLGLLHYNMKQEEQVSEVRRVKNHIHGMIGDPAVVSPSTPSPRSCSALRPMAWRLVLSRSSVATTRSSVSSLVAPSKNATANVRSPRS